MITTESNVKKQILLILAFLKLTKQNNIKFYLTICENTVYYL
jgi:hypothetical protein